MAKLLLSYFPRERRVKTCHRNFTAFFTQKFRRSKETRHLERERERVRERGRVRELDREGVRQRERELDR